MKNIRIGTIAVVLFALLIAVASKVDLIKAKEPVTFKQGEYTYEILSKNEVEVAEYDYPKYYGYPENPHDKIVDRIEIPQKITHKGNEYSVTSIGKGAFGSAEDTMGAKTIIIPEGIETIREAAFAGSAHLEEVVIPASVTSIEDGVFSDCGGISRLVVSEENLVYKTIDNEMFSKAGNILYHASIKDQYGTYTVPDGVKILAPYAFAGNPNVEGVVLPSSVEIIRKDAFRDLGYFNSGGPTINPVKIYIPETVRKIEEGAFKGTWLDVTLPKTMTSVPKGWFAGAIIEKIVIPDSVSVIEERVFYGADIRNIVLSKNITEIYGQAFGNINRYTKMNIKLSGTNGKLKYSNGVLYSKTGKTIVKALQPPANYKMPATVRIIRPYAFEETAVKSIVIPKGVKELPNGVFRNCKSLIKLDLPVTTTDIGVRAWTGSQLQTLIIRANKVPRIPRGQQMVFTVSVKKGRVNAYKEAIKGKFTYGKLKQI